MYRDNVVSPHAWSPVSALHFDPGAAPRPGALGASLALGRIESQHEIARASFCSTVVDVVVNSFRQQEGVLGATYSLFQQLLTGASHAAENIWEMANYLALRQHVRSYPDDALKELKKAVSEGNLKQVTHWIQAGVDQHAALDFAVAHDQGEIVYELLKPTAHGVQTPVHCALLNGLMSLAVKKGGVAVVHVLLSLGVKVNDPSVQPSLLHQAAAVPLPGDTQARLRVEINNAMVDLLTALLNAGADVHATDKDGRTPLHLAAISGQVGVAGILLSGGADAHAVDARNQTPIELASQSAQNHLVVLLRERGGDMTAR